MFMPDSGMQTSYPPQYRQNWTVKKALCYLAYVFVAKRLPASGQFGVIGNWSNRLRTILCRHLFLESESVISVGKGADFNNGANIVMKDDANIGNSVTMQRSTDRLAKSRSADMS
jgi:hypothetical protein